MSTRAILTRRGLRWHSCCPGVCPEGCNAQAPHHPCVFKGRESGPVELDDSYLESPPSPMAACPPTATCCTGKHWPPSWVPCPVYTYWPGPRLGHSSSALPAPRSAVWVKEGGGHVLTWEPYSWPIQLALPHTSRKLRNPLTFPGL